MSVTDGHGGGGHRYRYRRRSAGMFPLFTTLDLIGPLARIVDCCALFDQVMSGSVPTPVVARPIEALALAVPGIIVQVGIDGAVALAFSHAVDRNSAAGARITFISFDVTTDIVAANTMGGFAAAEAYRILKDRLECDEALFDPRVASRVRRGAAMSYQIN